MDVKSSQTHACIGFFCRCCVLSPATTKHGQQNKTKHGKQNKTQHGQHNTDNKYLLPSLQPVRRGGVVQKLNQRPMKETGCYRFFLEFSLVTFFFSKKSNIQCGQQDTHNKDHCPFYNLSTSAEWAKAKLENRESGCYRYSLCIKDKKERADTKTYLKYVIFFQFKVFSTNKQTQLSYKSPIVLMKISQTAHIFS